METLELRQHKILEQLEELKLKILSMNKDLNLCGKTVQNSTTSNAGTPVKKNPSEKSQKSSVTTQTSIKREIKVNHLLRPSAVCIIFLF